MTVIIPPAVAPAAAKQATVPSVGMLPGLFTTTSGSSLPVACPMTVEYLYLAFWYISNDIIRTSAILNTGAKTPMK